MRFARAAAATEPQKEAATIDCRFGFSAPDDRFLTTVAGQGTAPATRLGIENDARANVPDSERWRCVLAWERRRFGLVPTQGRGLRLPQGPVPGLRNFASFSPPGQVYRWDYPTSSCQWQQDAGHAASLGLVGRWQSRGTGGPCRNAAGARGLTPLSWKLPTAAAAAARTGIVPESPSQCRPARGRRHVGPDST
jgi:hypothetical protein